MKITVEFDSLAELDAFRKWKDVSKNDGKTRVVESDLDHRTKNILLAEGVVFVEDAQALSDQHLLTWPNAGRKFIDTVRAWRAASPLPAPKELK